MRFFLLISFSFSSFGNSIFMNSQFGLIFDSKSINKEVIDVSVCGEKFELLSEDLQGFSKLKLDEKIVYVNSKNLSKKKPDCINEKSKNFFRNLELSPEEIDYWAQLNEKISTN